MTELVGPAHSAYHLTIVKQYTDTVLDKTATIATAPSLLTYWPAVLILVPVNSLSGFFLMGAPRYSPIFPRSKLYARIG
ncbi:MAG: hypothetical protein ACSLEN_02700 [Candidatus Malihini olakiniferum]